MRTRLIIFAALVLGACSNSVDLLDRAAVTHGLPRGGGVEISIERRHVDRALLVPGTTTTMLEPISIERERVQSHEPAVPAHVDVEPAPVERDLSSIEQLIVDTFGAAGDKALRVAECESSMNPGAISGQHYGLFQIATRVHAARIEAMGYTAEDMLSAGPNVDVAFAIYSEQGWGPWQCA